MWNMLKEVLPALADSGVEDIESIDAETCELLTSSLEDTVEPHIVKQVLYAWRSLDMNGDGSSGSVSGVSGETMLIDEEDTECLLGKMIFTLLGGRFFRTSEGHVGLVRDCPAQSGDGIWVIFGCPNLLVLRPVRSHRVLISSAYIPGFMRGEAVGGKDVNGEIRAGDICEGRIIEEIKLW
jgi:hypothetical protein